MAVSEEKIHAAAAFPQARPIFQQPFSLPESAQTLAGIAFRAAGKSENRFPAASKFAGKLFQQDISDSYSLLEFSDSQKSIAIYTSNLYCNTPPICIAVLSVLTL